MYRMSLVKLQETSLLLALVLLVSSLLWPVGTRASELLMFEREGCVWCQRWDREIGPVYDKTAEARVLPLRRINAGHQTTGGIALASPVRFTPTFVVVDNGREIGRITGYLNDDAFWGLLAALATKITTSGPGNNRT
jgi:hypothetical protein